VALDHHSVLANQYGADHGLVIKFLKENILWRIATVQDVLRTCDESLMSLALVRGTYLALPWIIFT
jgi:hypothetical protein